jgi:adenosylcobinamide-GDP ribazoletransferase
VATLARLPPVWLSQALPYARSQGAASAIAGPSRLAGAFAALICLPLFLPLPLRLSLLLCPAFIALWLGRWARTAIGGYTGDVLGASILLCEALGLAALALLRVQVAS